MEHDKRIEEFLKGVTGLTPASAPAGAVLARGGKMTPLEMIAEWRRGCSCAPPERAEECHECTRALIDALEGKLQGLVTEWRTEAKEIEEQDWYTAPVEAGYRDCLCTCAKEIDGLEDASE